ncbi:MAG TPA: hypothetical protein VFE50_09045 [Cyclobacteriaceae bacterium]|nr:hypothetical protein [Cyclobacteriaceae bacterium]
MKSIVVAVFIFGSLQCFAQRSVGVKIYQNTDVFEKQYYDSRFGVTTKVNSVNYSRVSVALSIDRKNGWVQEVEVLMPEISRPLEKAQYPMNYKFRQGEFNGKVSAYSARYELNRLLTNAESRIAFFFGVGLNPYFVNAVYSPTSPNWFKSSTATYGVVLNITPRVAYRISERFSVDVNVPFKVYDLRGEYNYYRNPAIPMRQRKENTFSSVFFEQAYTFRVGVLYRLG